MGCHERAPSTQHPAPSDPPRWCQPPCPHSLEHSPSTEHTRLVLDSEVSRPAELKRFSIEIENVVRQPLLNQGQRHWTVTAVPPLRVPGIQTSTAPSAEPDETEEEGGKKEKKEK